MAQEYGVAFSIDLDKLVETVNKKLKEGWELWGDLIVEIPTEDSVGCFYQVVVKLNYNVPVTTIEEEVGIEQIPMSP